MDKRGETPWYAVPQAVNPRIFPKPKSTENWMSKGILGEQLWTQKWHWDFPMMLLSANRCSNLSYLFNPDETI